MDKIRQQKLEYFLLDLDGKIKEIKDYLMLDKGSLLLDAIDRFEEENAEFLQYNPSGQEELNKRKWIVQFILFPIIADDKVEELLQYHLLEALKADLDPEELMRMRAITISELLWPKLSQQYLKALMQNTQLIGSEPIGVQGEKNSFLPYIKNWISLYNRRFGIDKHSGLEPHQFVLEDGNAQKLSKGLKEKLLKVLRFYESLKVYSLSEIEGELRKMQMGFAAQQAAAYSISRDKEINPVRRSEASPPKHRAGIIKAQLKNDPVVPAPLPPRHEEPKKPVKKSLSVREIAEIQKDIMEDKKIKFMKEQYLSEAAKRDLKEKQEREKSRAKSKAAKVKSEDTKKEIIKGSVSELLEKYPALQSFKLTANSISLPVAPFSLTPSIQNWIQYYAKECGKGKHSPQERVSFLELLEKNQNINSADIQKLDKIFRSVDENSPLPFDKNKNELLLDLVRVGEKLKTEEDSVSPPDKSKPILKISGIGISKPENTKKDDGYLDLELVPASPSINKSDDNQNK